MVVRTDTPAVVASRKASLHLIFSERTHYCMFCPASGSGETTDCELQKLGYEHGLDCWTYAPNYKKQWPVDATRRYFVMDHGRCILCRRCLRACDEIAANHTLGLTQRGAQAMICADDELPSANPPASRAAPVCRSVPPARCMTARVSISATNPRSPAPPPRAWAAPWAAASRPSRATIICCASKAIGTRPTAACSAPRAG